MVGGDKCSQEIEYDGTSEALLLYYRLYKAYDLVHNSLLFAIYTDLTLLLMLFDYLHIGIIRVWRWND